MSQERRLYFLYLLGVEGWSFVSLRCLTEGKNSQTVPRCSISIHKSTFLPGHLQQVVLVPAGVLAILDLFLPPLYNRGVGLGVGRIWEAGVAATERRPAEVKQVRKHELPSHFNKSQGSNSRPFAVYVVRPNSHIAGGHFKDAALQDGRPEGGDEVGIERLTHI